MESLEVSGAPEDPLAELVYELLQGEMYGYRGELSQAFKHYHQAAKQTQDPDIAHRAVEIALWMNDFARAEQAIARWRELIPEDPRPWRVLGSIYAAQGRIEGAVAAYEKAIEMGRTAQGLSMVAVANSLSIEAARPHRLKVFRALLKVYPDDPHAHLHRALAAKEEGLLEEALIAINDTLQLRGHWARSIALKVEVLQALERDDEAVRTLRRALMLQTENPYGLRQLLVNLLSGNDRAEEALEALLPLVRQDPDNPSLQAKRGVLAMAVEDWEQARRAFLKLRHNPRSLVASRPTSFNHSVSSYFLGVLAEHDGDIQGAIDYYYQVEEGDYVGEDRYFHKSRARIGELLWTEGQVEHARMHLQVSRALSVEDESVVYLYVAEADMLYGNSEHAAGYALLSEALERYPQNDMLLYSRALHAERLGRLSQLEADLRKVLAKDPDHARALNALGYTWVDHGINLEEGMAYIQRAHEQLPEDAAILDSMGWAYYRLGDLVRAESFLRRAQTMMPEAEITAHLVEVLWKLGRHEEARRLYQSAVEQDPDNEFLERVARRFPL